MVEILFAKKTDLDTHTADVANPHTVTAAQVGLVVGTDVAALTGANAALEHILLVAEDETTQLIINTSPISIRMPYAFTLTEVRAHLTTVSSSGAVIIDINEAGTTILSTKLTIDVSELSSKTAATPVVISDTALADDALITIDIDAPGTAAAGLKVVLIGRQA